MKIDWSKYDKYMGTCTDAELADEVDTSREHIGVRRRSLGIKSYNKPSQVIDWDKYDHFLGTMSDMKLSKLIKCFHITVSNRRNKLDISRYK